MGNFNLPRFQYIINNDEQAQLFGDDGGGAQAYAATLLSPTNAAHKFSVIGELDWNFTTSLALQETAVRIRVESSSNGTARSVDYQVTGTIDATHPVAAGHVVRVVTDMPSKEVTAYQNIPIEKRYQIPSECTSAEEVAQGIVDAISADSNALVTATIGAGGGAFTIDDNDVLTKSNLYVGLAPDGEVAAWGVTATVQDEGAGPINTYETLKNLQWSNSVDFDRNVEYYPERGVGYNSYTFFIETQEVASGGQSLPSQIPGTFKAEYVFYVKGGLDLDTAFAAFATDMNV